MGYVNFIRKYEILVLQTNLKLISIDDRSSTAGNHAGILTLKLESVHCIIKEFMNLLFLFVLECILNYIIIVFVLGIIHIDLLVSKDKRALFKATLTSINQK